MELIFLYALFTGRNQMTSRFIKPSKQPTVINFKKILAATNPFAASFPKISNMRTLF